MVARSARLGRPDVGLTQRLFVLGPAERTIVAVNNFVAATLSLQSKLNLVEAAGLVAGRLLLGSQRRPRPTSIFEVVPS